jgi:hypothetical protein
MENYQNIVNLNWIKVTNLNTLEVFYIPDVENNGSFSLQNTTVSNAITASYSLSGGNSTNTGSLLTTASFDLKNIIFTKGDGSAFSINLQSLAVDSASYATTTPTATTASYAINHAVITSSYICDGKLDANQSFPTGSDAVIAFVDYADPNNWLSGSKFIPNITGYYNMSFGAWLNNAGISSNQVNVQMRKNGGQTMVILQQPLNNGTGISLSGNRVVYMNGTTDYIEWTVFQGAGAGPTGTLLQGTPDGSGTWFSAFLITQ